MRTTYLKMTIGFMVFFAFSACAARPKERPKAEADTAGATEFAEESPYYYFTRAQLDRSRGRYDQAIGLLKKAIALDADSVFLHKELTDLYLLQKDNRNALRVVEEILEKHPDDIKSLITYGKIKQSLKQLDDAKRAYRQVIARDPDQRDIYLLLGGIYMQEDDLSAALALYRQLIEQYPESYIGHFFIGRIYARQGKPAAAETEFLKTLELNPNLEEPRFELIKLYQAQGREDKVLALYKEILAMNPNHVRAALGLGYYYQQHGRPDAAASIFASLGKRSLKDPNVIRYLVQEYIDNKAYDAVIVILKGMLEGAPESSDLNYVAGVAYDGKGEKQAAIDHFSRVSDDSKFYLSARVQIAFLLQDTGQVEKGIEQISALIRKFPENADLYVYLGSFYEESEVFDRAVEALENAIRLEPDNAKAYFRLGVVYDKQGNKTASIAAMKKVIALDPKNANALNYLGYTYADLGRNLKEAERLVREALKLKPEDGYITDSLGWVFYKQGYYESALKYLKKAAEIVPDDPVILEHLGDVHLKINEPQKALEFYRRSLPRQKKEPEKTNLQKKIQTLTGKEF